MDIIQLCTAQIEQAVSTEPPNFPRGLEPKKKFTNADDHLNTKPNNIKLEGYAVVRSRDSFQTTVLVVGKDKIL